MNNDLISREDLKKALHNFFDGKVIDEPTYILRDVFYHIDNAPTPLNPTIITCNTNALSNEEIEKLIKTIQSARIVPDYLQGWRYEETPQQGEWNNHTVACLLAELFGDPCACNHCGIDEWLPKKCDFANKECPDVVGVACWEQFLKHRKGGAE